MATALSFRDKRRLKRQIRSDIMELRRDNPKLSDEEFKDLAEGYLKSEYEGIDPDNLNLILEFLKEILPLILNLFTVVLIVCVLLPATAMAQPPMFAACQDCVVQQATTVTQYQQVCDPITGECTVVAVQVPVGSNLAECVDCNTLNATTNASNCANGLCGSGPVAGVRQRFRGWLQSRPKRLRWRR